MPAMVEPSSTSLHRAVAILDVLGSEEATSRGGLGVVEIAHLVDREKSQVSRALRVLAGAGLVDRDPDTLGYRLGWRLFTLAASAGHQRLLALAPGVMRRLVAALGERAHLTVLEGCGVLTVLSESPPRLIQSAGWVGRVTPLHCTSSGRALLFDHTDEEVRNLLGGSDLPLAGPRAPRDAADFLRRLHRARQAGYALIDEEFEPGHVAVAAPIRDFRSRVVAAVNISAPKFRLHRGLDAAGRQVRAAADGMSAALGHPEPAPTATAHPRRSVSAGRKP